MQPRCPHCRPRLPPDTSGSPVGQEAISQAEHAGIREFCGAHLQPEIDQQGERAQVNQLSWVGEKIVTNMQRFQCGQKIKPL